MQRFILLILIVISTTSCENKIEQLQLQTLTASLEKSNAVIAANNRSQMHAFEIRLRNPYENSEDAKNYFSKAEAVNKLTDSVIGYLNAVRVKLKNKEQISITKNDWLVLYKTLKDYQTSILQLDTNVNKEFDKHLEIINPYFDSTNNDTQNFISQFFNNSGTNSALATLTTFQNNILIAQSDINGYFNKKCLRNYCGYDQILPLVSQDKSYVKAGDSLKITAGIGAFTTSIKPIIRVNGANVPLNAEGYYVYGLKVSSKTGKHAIPIVIEFSDFTGKKNILEKQIKYTVINFDSTLNK